MVDGLVIILHGPTDSEIVGVANVNLLFKEGEKTGICFHNVGVRQKLSFVWSSGDMTNRIEKGRPVDAMYLGFQRLGV